MTKMMCRLIVKAIYHGFPNSHILFFILKISHFHSSLKSLSLSFCFTNVPNKKSQWKLPYHFGNIEYFIPDMNIAVNGSLELYCYLALKRGNSTCAIFFSRVLNCSDTVQTVASNPLIISTVRFFLLNRLHQP